MIADVTIIYEALDGQQLIVLQEDLGPNGLLNQDMPVVYTQSDFVVTEGTSIFVLPFVDMSEIPASLNPYMSSFSSSI